MSRTRLDQVLLRQGVITEDQIKQALMRQRSRGGRLGSHLFFFRFLSEEQLVNALTEQLGAPGVQLSEMQISDEVVQKVPVKLVDTFNVLPFAFDPETLSLSLAVIDPDNKEALEQIKQASGAREVKPFVAVDSVLRNKIAHYYHGRMSDPSSRQVIELPDLFEEEKSLADLEDVDQPVDDAKITDPLNVLMITKAAFLRNVLASIFEREGYTLQIHYQPEEITRALNESSFDYVLVEQDMEEDFSRWIKEGTIPFPRAEISLFSTICGSLLDNPAPYPMMIESLIRSLQKFSEFRQVKNTWKPPYELICNDIRDLGRALDLRRIAVDGMQIISSTLMPAENNSPADQDQPGNFALQFEKSNGSRSALACLHFPWDLEGCLHSFFELLSGKLALTSSDDRKREMLLGPQILAVAWYRHYIADGIEGDSEAIIEATNTLLRKKEGHLFSSEVLGTYLRILEQTRKQGRIDIQNDIFVISESNEIVKQFSTHMRKGGFRIVTIDNLPEARSLYERQRPDIIVINYDCYPNHAMKFSRFVKKDSKTLLYAITNQNKSSLIMSLLDSGFSDVFTPPFKYDIIVARINKSIAILSELSSGSKQYRGFNGTFQELPLINLVQALAMSQRDVHITLEKGKEDSADIFMRNGQMVYSKYGEVEGVDAIYKIIGWGDNGSFKIEHAQTFPPDNISLPNDFIIMEGCRQIDEERI